MFLFVVVFLRRIVPVKGPLNDQGRSLFFFRPRNGPREASERTERKRKTKNQRRSNGERRRSSWRKWPDGGGARVGLAPPTHHWSSLISDDQFSLSLSLSYFAQRCRATTSRSIPRAFDCSLLFVLPVLSVTDRTLSRFGIDLPL